MRFCQKPEKATKKEAKGALTAAKGRIQEKVWGVSHKIKKKRKAITRNGRRISQ